MTFLKIINLYPPLWRGLLKPNHTFDESLRYRDEGEECKWTKESLMCAIGTCLGLGVFEWGFGDMAVTKNQCAVTRSSISQSSLFNLLFPPPSIYV